MDNMTVGMENLPNVFIDKIYIQPSGEEHKMIDVRLAMFDHFPKRSWKRSDMSDLKVKIAFLTGEDILFINHSVASLYDYDVSLENVFEEHVSQFGTYDEFPGFTKFTMNFQFICTNPTDLNVYAACFIDGLDFDNDLFNKFYGPMAAEKIYVGGEINDQTGYFYYRENNKEYGGPVHSHGSGYMVGSEHKDVFHKRLMYVPESNYKIVAPESQTDTEYDEDQETTVEGEVIGSGTSQTYTPPND